VDFEQSVGGVVLADEQGFELDFEGAFLEGFHGGRQVAGDVLPLPAELEKRLGVLEKPLQLATSLDAVSEAGAALLEGANFLGPGPDLGLGEPFLDPVELLSLRLGIKGTS
jgi:hypothetical protein